MIDVYFVNVLIMVILWCLILMVVFVFSDCLIVRSLMNLFGDIILLGCRVFFLVVFCSILVLFGVLVESVLGLGDLG